MTIRDGVLLYLEENKNKAVSGEEMAEKLSCTRAAIGKAVNELRSAGYAIFAVNKVGYTLTYSGDTLMQPMVREKLNENLRDFHMECMESVDSTNSYLKRLVAAGEKRDMAVVAASQTAGRGRRGRSFYSPVGSGLYMSFLLHPKCSAEDAVMLTTVAAVAEAMAIEEVTGEKAEIKWVNDLVIRHRKVSGILTEASTSMEDGGLDYCIVGIGINLYDPDAGWPDDISAVAGSVTGITLKEASDAGKRRDISRYENLKNNFSAALINRFMEFYSAFPNTSYLSEYEKRCFCIGKRVKILTSDHEEMENDAVHDRSHALVLGINDHCHLHLRYDDGYEEYLSSGEISIRL